MLAVVGIVVLVQVSRHFARSLTSTDLAAMIDRHGLAVLGIPAALVVAFILIGLVRALDGPITFEMLGLKAEGAGAIIWIAPGSFCFAGTSRWLRPFTHGRHWPLGRITERVADDGT